MGNCHLKVSPGHPLYLFWAIVLYHFITTKRSPKKDIAAVLVAGVKLQSAIRFFYKLQFKNYK
jgi:hypothetical protein